MKLKLTSSACSQTDADKRTHKYSSRVISSYHFCLQSGCVGGEKPVACSEQRQGIEVLHGKGRQQHWGGVTAPRESALAVFYAKLSRELAPTNLCRQVQVSIHLEFIFPEIRHKSLAFAHMRPVHFSIPCGWQRIPSRAVAGCAPSEELQELGS